MGKIKIYLINLYILFSYIDDVLLTMRAKNASEILDDATLVCSYSFDGGSYYDSGPLHLNGIAVNVSFVNGRVNEAISFISNSSYYQVRETNYLICLNNFYRSMDSFFLVYPIIHIQLLYGFIPSQTLDQLLFIFQQQQLGKDGVVILWDFLLMVQ
jgi:hypothetical protein